MAKRRNLKKEKALRNLAYARQFRKKPAGFTTHSKRYSNQNNKTEDSPEENDML